MAAQTAPCRSMGKAAMAFSSFSPPRLTYASVPPRTSIRASSATAVPGLSTRWPFTKTSPLMMTAWARWRLS